MKESLERSLTNDIVKEGESSLCGMPIVLIQARGAGQEEKELVRLAERGRTVASR